LISTIVYADREAAANRKKQSIQELCRKVKEIKPRFAGEFITGKIHELAGKDLLLATQLATERGEVWA